MLFNVAKSAAPCILVLDGIENIGRVRGNDSTTQGTMDRILSTLLMELDGIDDDDMREGYEEKSSPRRIAVIGITQNDAWLDPALRRPGRLEKTIELGLPDYSARTKIAQKAISKMSISFPPSSSMFDPQMKETLAEWIGLQTPGWTALGVRSLCQEAAMTLLRDLMRKRSYKTRKPDQESDAISEKEAIHLTFSHFARAMQTRKGINQNH